jgi:hypothetical protein
MKFAQAEPAAETVDIPVIAMTDSATESVSNVRPWAERPGAQAADVEALVWRSTVHRRSAEKR